MPRIERGRLTSGISQSLISKCLVQGLLLYRAKFEAFNTGSAFLPCDWVTGTRMELRLEDMLYSPKAYLQGVDPELDNYGLTAALDMWLEFVQEGLIQGPLCR